MRATRAEVARLAGVSPAVVSYVLNGGPRNVAPETRRRVEEAIASLEYRPNAIAQALRGGRSGAIGVVVGPGAEGMFSALTPALQAASIEFGYAMYVSLVTDAGRERQDARSLVDRRVDALIAVEPEDPSSYAQLQADGTPVAFIGNRVCEDVSISLVTDPVAAHRALVERVENLDVGAVVRSAALPKFDTASAIPAAGGSARMSHSIDSGTTVDIGTAAGGAELLEVLRRRAGTAVMCATDAELDRALWLLGAVGLEREGHYFTSSRTDLRVMRGPVADIEINWDLKAGLSSILGDLIKQCDGQGVSFSHRHAAWTVSGLRYAESSMTWGEQDL